VAVLATCLADVVRPQAVEAAVKLLRAAGAEVHVPEGQTCCGQPGYNAGDRAAARDVAATTLRALMDAEAVVVPSGSCAGMLMRHWPRLFAETDLATAAERVAARSFELCRFLHLREAEPLAGRWHLGPVVFHDSCALRREVADIEAPRALLSAVPGLEVITPEDAENCCGFGGLFSMELPEISARLADERIAAFRATGARVLAGVDTGCLMHLAGRMAARAVPVAVFHVAEILAGMVRADTPGLNGITPAEALAAENETAGAATHGAAKNGEAS
jgi:L-lactate dehydrogenase complex protein LldE